MIPDSGFQISECPGGQSWNLKSGAWNLICITQTTDQIPPDNDWLGNEERLAEEKLLTPKRRSDWRLGRWTAKQAICAFKGLDGSMFRHIEIRTAADRAPDPYFHAEPADVWVSISHSRDRGFCLAGPKHLAAGCDLEWVEPREKNFARDYFTPEEVDFVVRAGGDRDIAETLIWCAKEAALKVIRKGLTLDTRSIAIRPDFSGARESWQRWTGECPESLLGFRGLWRFANGFIYTVAVF